MPMDAVPRKVPIQCAQPRRRLEPADVSGIVGLLDGWTNGTRVTWEGLVDHVGQMLGHRWTRQTLEANPDVKAAYLRRRDRDQAGKPPPKEKDPVEVVLRKQVEALKAENEGLRRTLVAYEERFVRYEYNAYRKGVSPQELGMELERPDRGQDEESGRG